MMQDQKSQQLASNSQELIDQFTQQNPGPLKVADSAGQNSTKTQL